MKTLTEKQIYIYARETVESKIKTTEHILTKIGYDLLPEERIKLRSELATLLEQRDELTRKILFYDEINEVMKEISTDTIKRYMNEKFGIPDAIRPEQKGK